MDPNDISATDAAWSEAVRRSAAGGESSGERISCAETKEAEAKDDAGVVLATERGCGISRPICGCGLKRVPSGEESVRSGSAAR